MQFIATGEKISQDIQKQDLMKSQREELQNADLLEQVSTYNMLKMYIEEPTDESKSGKRRRRRLREKGLLRQEWGDIPYSHRNRP